MCAKAGHSGHVGFCPLLQMEIFTPSSPKPVRPHDPYRKLHSETWVQLMKSKKLGSLGPSFQLLDCFCFELKPYVLEIFRESVVRSGVD